MGQAKSGGSLEGATWRGAQRPSGATAIAQEGNDLTPGKRQWERRKKKKAGLGSIARAESTGLAQVEAGSHEEVPGQALVWGRMTDKQGCQLQITGTLEKAKC